MLLYLLYTPFVLLLISNLISLYFDSDEKRFSVSMIQTMAGMPLMAGLYFYTSVNPKPEWVPLLLFSETVFAFNWFYMAFRLERTTVENNRKARFSKSISNLLAEPRLNIIGTAVMSLSLFFTIYPPPISLDGNYLILELYWPVNIFAIFLLISALAAAWNLEKFLRALAPKRRWAYRLLVVVSFSICGAMGWAASFRLTFMYLASKHLMLLAILFFFAWLFICYAVARHRLLNRKMFISRKIVYSFTSPLIFAAYFLALGFITLTSRYFGLTFPFALFWFIVSVGGVAIGVYITSENVRKRVRYFISTHFYINKYEYRDEWLTLSRELQGAFSEAEVMAALSDVLAQSLYTDNIAIWLGDAERGYKLVSLHGPVTNKSYGSWLSADDPLILHCRTQAYFYIYESPSEAEWQAMADNKKDLFSDLNLVLFSPLLAGDHFIGLIGLGPEYTGGRYGQDDFDLLTAIGTQAASALLSVRMAEELSSARESQAWNKLSSFVLHDIKNASNMLSLAKKNAEHHINKPRFQRDLLETVDGALRRMSKIQSRLKMLDKEVKPNWQNMKLYPFLKDVCQKYRRQLRPMMITLDCPTGIQLYSDPKLLNGILENLLLNAFEAADNGGMAKIKAYHDKIQKQIFIEVIDCGPGIPNELLPDALFEKYKSTKSGGSGIGLWQVHVLAKGLKGTVKAENTAEGARFVLQLPMVNIL